MGHTLRINVEGKKQGREAEDDNVSGYWMTLRTRQDTADLKWRYYFTLCGRLALEGVMDLS
jgi:hypothetical protein